jgi:rubredoxin
MPKREDEFWVRQKELEEQEELRGGKRFSRWRGQYCCPKCGNINITYNEKFQSWRCNGCEHNFTIPSHGLISGQSPKVPWNEDWFKIGKENEMQAVETPEEKLKPEEEIIEPKQEIKENREDLKQNIQDIEEIYDFEEEQKPIDIVTNNEPVSKSKAWFGNEYYDKKTKKWKKPGVKTSTKIASVIALLFIIAIVVLILLYIFV